MLQDALIKPIWFPSTPEAKVPWMSSNTEISMQNPRPFPFLSFFVTRFAILNLPVEMKYKGQSRKTVFYWKSFLWVIFCYRIFLVLALQFLPLLLRTEWSCEQKINKDCDMKLQFPICAKTLSCPHSSETDESLQRGKTNQCWKNLTILQKSNCKWSLRLPLYQQHSQIKFHPHFQSLRTPSGIFSADVTVPTVGWKLFKVLQTLILNAASSSLPINLHNKQ